MTTLPRQITLTYTLSVPITFLSFVQFVNKTALESNYREEELTTHDMFAQRLWAEFTQRMKDLNKKLPSGKNVNINHEPDHEAVFILRDMVNELLEEAQSSDEEVEEEEEEEDEPSEIEPNETPL